MQVWNLGGCYAFFAGLAFVHPFHPECCGTHSMWRVQASITLFSQTILSENSAPFMRVLRGSSSLFLAPQGSEEKPSH